MAGRVHNKQLQLKRNHDIHAKKKTFAIDDPDFICKFRKTGQRWIPSIVTEIRGKQVIYVELPDEHIARRHIDHVQLRTSQHEGRDKQVHLDDILPQPAAPVEDTQYTQNQLL